MWRYTSIWDVLNIIKANIIFCFIGINPSVHWFVYLTIFIIDILISVSLICISRLAIRMFFAHMAKKHKKILSENY